MRKPSLIILLSVAAMILLFIFSGCELFKNTVTYLPLESSETESTQEDTTAESEETIAPNPDYELLSSADLFIEENMNKVVDYILYDYSELGMNLSGSLSKNNSDWFRFQTERYKDSEMSVNELIKLVSSYFYDELKAVISDNEDELDYANPEDFDEGEGEYRSSDIDYTNYEFNCYFEQTNGYYEIYFCYA